MKSKKYEKEVMAISGWKRVMGLENAPKPYDSDDGFKYARGYTAHSGSKTFSVIEYEGPERTTREVHILYNGTKTFMTGHTASLLYDHVRKKVCNSR